MARANLTVNDDLLSAFITAQKTLSLRWIQAGVEQESIVQTGSGIVEGNEEIDFARLASSLSDDSPSFIAFCLDDPKGDEGMESIDRPRRWTLISWVPENSKVRSKMLYSSSREDFKKSLGAGYFSNEYFATDAHDMTWETFTQATRSAEGAEEPLTEVERLVKEEALLEKDTAVRSSAMAAIAFPIEDDVRTQIKEFLTGTVTILELTLTDKETVGLASAHSIEGPVVLGQVSGLVSNSEPRFLLVKFPSGNDTLIFFIYSCPESAALRMKMTYSSAKATIIAETTQEGVNIDKTVEVNDTSDIEAVVSSEVTAQSDAKDAGGHAPLEHAASESKPKRPGKGRARLSSKMKFVPDLS